MNSGLLRMARFRSQVGLKALLAFTTFCAVLAAIVKCENDASRVFAAKETIIETALGTILPKVEQELYETWLQEAKATNPTTFAEWEKLYGYLKDKAKLSIVVHPDGSESRAFDYFGSLHEWRIVRYTNFPSHCVDVKITCLRPCSLLSRTTSVSIVVHPTPDKKRFIDPLKSELAQKGIHYEIEENPKWSLGSHQARAAGRVVVPPNCSNFRGRSLLCPRLRASPIRPDLGCCGTPRFSKYRCVRSARRCRNKAASLRDHSVDAIKAVRSRSCTT